MPTKKRLLISAAVFCAFLLTCSAQKLPGPVNPDSLVRQAVKNELTALDQDRSRWMYRLHREDEKNTQDRQVIETNEGNLAKVLFFNGQPLTIEQRMKDTERMREQVNNPEARARRVKREKTDAEKARQLLKGIPDGFFFSYDGTENGLVRIAFTPNPKYSPPTRELTVYHSMKGNLWIDPQAVRLARIEGQLFEDVNFGWGLLGHLDKGGTFKVVQQDVANGHWESVLIDLNLHGRAVIFKTLAIHQKQIFSDFRRMPDNITLMQALEMLEKPQPVAQEQIKNQLANDKQAEAKTSHQ